MPLINRFTSLLSADVHAVLDKIEDPIASLKFAVREMEESLTEIQKQNEAVRRQEQKLQRQLRDSERLNRDLEQQLDVCFDSGEEALAKSVLRRKLANDAKRASIEKSLLDSEAAIIRQTNLVEENERRLAATREKLALLEHETETTPSPFTTKDIGEPDISNEAVDIAFLKEKQRRAK